MSQKAPSIRRFRFLIGPGHTALLVALLWAASLAVFLIALT